MKAKQISNLIPRQLEDGLLLRCSTPADSQALVDFNSRLHSEEGPDKPDERIGAWVNDLMTRPHPTFDPADFTIVEDTHTGKIISSMNLIPQTWTYAGIPFGVGRPEVVGTLKEYRKKGLIRHQFEVVHEWCRQRGLAVQAITGIPYYYRQFGYEMALDLSGGRMGYEAQLPRLKKDEKEPYLIRPAKEGDISFIYGLYTRAYKRSLVACQWDETSWKYVLKGMSTKNINRPEIRIIENLSSKSIGFLTHPWFNWGPPHAEHLPATIYELESGNSWLSITPSVARYLWKTSGEYAAANKRKNKAYSFWLGNDHPVYNVMRDRLPRIRDTYSFFMRVPDLAGFLRHITPVLDNRIKESSLVVGYSGSLSLNFYRSGLKLIFDKGRLKSIESFTPVDDEDGDAAFPDLTFLQLLFGYRTFSELQSSFTDCFENNPEAHVLLDVLFPKQPSHVSPLP